MSNDQQSDEDPEDSSSQEASALLPRSNDGREHSSPLSRTQGPRIPLPERRQSSLSIPSPNGVPRKPRTPNRVRFDVEGEQGNHDHAADRPGPDPEEEDRFEHDTSTHGRGSISQRAPLLTGIEAPSVTLASTDFDFNADDLLENSRPKSGMRSAFMNMANSIMYVCHQSRLCSTTNIGKEVLAS